MRSAAASRAYVVRRSSTSRPEQKPVRAGLAERHADASRVNDARRADHAVKLHVRMAAHHYGGVGMCEDRIETLVRRQPREDVDVVSRCGVAEEHLTAERRYVQPDGRWPGAKHTCVIVGKLRGHPAHALPKRGGNGARLVAIDLREHLAVAVAA
jgi:hypothetical protein